METWSVDVAILGSGFAGSIAAMILKRLDLSPLVIDKTTHPRFAIGESSTPIANRVLFDLAERYDLLRLAPLCKYGPWLRHYPQLVCGKKRGFSYYPHTAGEAYSPRADHANELLVAASATDEHCDTHWLRADVDQFLASEVERLGIPLLQQTELRSFEQGLSIDPAGGWLLRGTRDDKSVEIRARFVIDATGEAAVLPKALGAAADSTSLRTHSRGLFSHWTGLAPWSRWLTEHGGMTTDHPFDCDDAAQHHLLDGAWMWVLRFRNGVTSAGLAIDPRRWPTPTDQTPEEEWQAWLDRYPSVADILRGAQVTQPPGKVIRTGRLQRRMTQIVGANWAALPHTAGFIDPLHSSGIGHSLSGVERLMHILEAHWQRDSLAEKLRDYQQMVLGELDLIDQLVAGCYSSFSHFPLLISYSMLYFAAATTCEQRRATEGYDPRNAFLLANDPQFRSTVRDIGERLSNLLGVKLGESQPRDAVSVRTPTAAQIADFESYVAAQIKPFNSVGLCDPAAHNLYRYTAAPE